MIESDCVSYSIFVYEKFHLIFHINDCNVDVFMVLYHKFKFTEFQDLDTDSRTDTTCPVGTGYMLNTLILQMWNYKGIAQETVSS